LSGFKWKVEGPARPLQKAQPSYFGGVRAKAPVGRKRGDRFQGMQKESGPRLRARAHWAAHTPFVMAGASRPSAGSPSDPLDSVTDGGRTRHVREACGPLGRRGPWIGSGAHAAGEDPPRPSSSRSRSGHRSPPSKNCSGGGGGGGGSWPSRAP